MIMFSEVLHALCQADPAQAYFPFTVAISGCATKSPAHW